MKSSQGRFLRQQLIDWAPAAGDAGSSSSSSSGAAHNDPSLYSARSLHAGEFSLLQQQLSGTLPPDLWGFYMQLAARAEASESWMVMAAARGAVGASPGVPGQPGFLAACRSTETTTSLPLAAPSPTSPQRPLQLSATSPGYWAGESRKHWCSWLEAVDAGWPAQRLQGLESLLRLCILPLK